MSKQSKIGGTSIVEFAWLSKQFDELHKDHLLILKKIDDLKNVIPEFISPELQEQIIKSVKLTAGIDQKVPDKT